MRALMALGFLDEKCGIDSNASALRRSRTLHAPRFAVLMRSSERPMNIFERDWHARPGASEGTVQQLVDTVSIELPAAYLALLKLTNGGEGPLCRQPYHLQLDSAETVLETAASERLTEFFPGFLIIGSNGGGEYIALDARESGALPVVALDMTNADLKDTVLPIAENFDAFVELIGIAATA